MPSNRTPPAPMDYSVRFEYWRQFDSLTIGNIAWMMNGIEPRLELELPDWADSDTSHEIEVVVAAAYAGTIDVSAAFDGAGPKVSTQVKRNARLFDWLRDKGWNEVAVGLDAPMPSQSRASTKAPFPRHAAQEAAILAELLKQGHNPVALPRAAPGKPGVKALVKRALGNTGMWAGKTVFGKAWDRLRARGEIA